MGWVGERGEGINHNIMVNWNENVENVLFCGWTVTSRMSLDLGSVFLSAEVSPDSRKNFDR